jgi:hypothetical protein
MGMTLLGAAGGWGPLITYSLGVSAALIGLCGAIASGGQRWIRGGSLLVAAWGVLALATGDASTATWILVGGGAAIGAAGSATIAVLRRPGRKGNELASARRAARRLFHKPPVRDLTIGRCGAAFLLCRSSVGDAEIALSHLRRLSFYSPEEKLLLAESLGTLVELGAKLDEIDGSLLRSSADDLRDQVHGEHYFESPARPAALEALEIGPLNNQSLLESEFRDRDGPAGEWFRQVLAKRRLVLEALVEAKKEIADVRDKAVWMAARQQERGDNDEVELIDPQVVLDQVRHTNALVSALAEGVAEVHGGPIVRL